MSGEGKLGFVVWPSYVGAHTDRGEPTDSLYQRGQITWSIDPLDPSAKIVGRALVWLPAGTFTHLTYHSSPEGGVPLGKIQLDHPLVFDYSGRLEVYPITNPDLCLHQYQASI